jgi:hypothetical protein
VVQIRRHTGNTKGRREGRFYLLVACCGFLALLGALIYILNSQSFTEAREQQKFLSDYEKVEGDYIYNFMNEINQVESNDDPSLQVKLDCLTSLLDFETIDDYVNGVSSRVLSEEDKEFMMEQYTDKKYLWDKSKLKGYWVLYPKDLNVIEGETPKDYWDTFRVRYGNFGLHDFSIPMFNRDKTFAVVLHAYQAGLDDARGMIEAYRKVNGRWVLYERIRLWVV